MENRVILNFKKDLGRPKGQNPESFGSISSILAFENLGDGWLGGWLSGWAGRFGGWFGRANRRLEYQHLSDPSIKFLLVVSYLHSFTPISSMREL